jgi:O-antigen/teichoic acid export membrane protein
MIFQSIVAQALALLARIVIFRYLDKDDIAVASWAASASSFIFWMQPALGEVLVQRQKRFKRWVNPAFWVTIYSGAAIVVASLLLGPFLMPLYHHDWRVAPLIVLACGSSVLAALGTLWVSEQSIQFRFRQLAMIATVGSLYCTVLTILMARLQTGPWAIAVPVTSVNGVLLVLYVMVGKFRPRRPPRLAALLSVTRPGMMIAVAGFFGSLVMQFDNFSVGLFQSPADLAAYALAFSMSYQAMGLLSRGLRGVMLPAFSALVANPERRVPAYLEALRLSCWICMPSLILPIPVMGFLVPLVFSSKWVQAVPLVQIFLLGVGYIMVYMIAFTFMQALGHFRRYMITSIVHGVLFAAAVFVAAKFGNVLVVTTVVSASYALTSFVWAQLATTEATPRMRVAIAAAGFVPHLLACVGAGAAYLATGSIVSPWLRAIAELMVGCIVYAGLSWLFLRQSVYAAWERVRRLGGKVLPKA